MTSAPSRSKVIAFVWDFDGTLGPGNMQEPLFRRFGIDGDAFWNEVIATGNARRAAGYNVRSDSVYLERFLAYVHQEPAPGIAPPLAGLSNDDLRALGPDLDLFPGVVDLLAGLRALPETDPQLEGFVVEHYVVSAGFTAMIQGSVIAPYLSGIIANEFAEGIYRPGRNGSPGELLNDGVITHVVHDVNHAGKSRALFEINKGVHVYPDRHVDDEISDADRYVPFEHMIYIADGPSDIPAFAVMRKQGGTTIAVYDPTDPDKRKVVEELYAQGRVHHVLEAHYEPGGPTWETLRACAARIAETTRTAS